VLCEELYGDANSKGLAAANAAGAAASIEAAAAGERYAAVEGALPASAEDMVAIIGLHAQAGERYRFATCQLMLLAGNCMVRCYQSPCLCISSTKQHATCMRSSMAVG
jgi:hypothetical protein